MWLCGVSRGRVCCLRYQHPDTNAKPAQTAETIRCKRWEGGGGGVGQISSKVPDLARLLLPLGVMKAFPKWMR